MKTTMHSITLSLVIILSSVLSFNANAVKHDSKSHGYSKTYGVVTPANVYGILENVHVLIDLYAKNNKPKAVATLKEISAQNFNGKSPEHALMKVNELTTRLDIISKKQGIAPTTRIQKEKSKAIPAEVYLQSAHTMDTLVKLLNKLEPNKAMGQYYVDRKYTHKVGPSKVYALADLLVKKINVILN